MREQPAYRNSISNQRTLQQTRIRSGLSRASIFLYIIWLKKYRRRIGARIFVDFTLPES